MTIVFSAGQEDYIAQLNALVAVTPHNNEVNGFSKNQYVVPSTTTDASTIAIDASLSNNFHLNLPSLASARVLGNPINLVAGMIINISITQGAEPSTLTYDSLWKFPLGAVTTLTATAGAKDFLSGYYDGTIIRASISKGYA